MSHMLTKLGLFLLLLRITPPRTHTPYPLGWTNGCIIGTESQLATLWDDTVLHRKQLDNLVFFFCFSSSSWCSVRFTVAQVSVGCPPDCIPCQPVRVLVFHDNYYCTRRAVDVDGHKSRQQRNCSVDDIIMAKKSGKLKWTTLKVSWSPRSYIATACLQITGILRLIFPYPTIFLSKLRSYSKTQISWGIEFNPLGDKQHSSSSREMNRVRW